MIKSIGVRKDGYIGILFESTDSIEELLELEPFSLPSSTAIYIAGKSWWVGYPGSKNAFQLNFPNKIQAIKNAVHDFHQKNKLLNDTIQNS